MVDFETLASHLIDLPNFVNLSFSIFVSFFYLFSLSSLKYQINPENSKNLCATVFTCVVYVVKISGHLVKSSLGK